MLYIYLALIAARRIRRKPRTIVSLSLVVSFVKRTRSKLPVLLPPLSHCVYLSIYPPSLSVLLGRWLAINWVIYEARARSLPRGSYSVAHRVSGKNNERPPLHTPSVFVDSVIQTFVGLALSSCFSFFRSSAWFYRPCKKLGPALQRKP